MEGVLEEDILKSARKYASNVARFRSTWIIAPVIEARGVVPLKRHFLYLSRLETDTDVRSH